jgi:hypothetical protein
MQETKVESGESISVNIFFKLYLRKMNAEVSMTTILVLIEEKNRWKLNMNLLTMQSSSNVLVLQAANLRQEKFALVANEEIRSIARRYQDLITAKKAIV